MGAVLKAQNNICDLVYRLQVTAALASSYARLVGECGLRITVEHDMSAWASGLRTAAGNDGVNPSFDPQFSDVGSSTAFWLALRNNRDDVLGCSAVRVIQTDDFVSLMPGLRLWYATIPQQWRGSLMATLPHMPCLAGKVGHVGGLWLHPTVRRLGLPAVMIRMIRAITADRFDVDLDTAAMFEYIARQPSLRRAYGFSHLVQCTDDYFPPKGRTERIFLMYSSRAELDEMVSTTLSAVARHV